MIRTSTQLKAKIHNLAVSKGVSAQGLQYIYMIERLLERLAQSPYRQNFILKGGVLTASMIGVENRLTTDLDLTVQNEPLSVDVMRTIADIDLDDNVRFSFDRVKTLMEEREHPGIRITGTAALDKMIVPVQMDLSAGDVITPGAIEYPYRLLLEDRTVPLAAYNVETVLAEKMHAILTRQTDNTRMRDFYDVFMIEKLRGSAVDWSCFAEALRRTADQRGASIDMGNLDHILEALEQSTDLQSLWQNYQRKMPFARGMSWSDAMESVGRLADFADFTWSTTRQTKPAPAREIKPRKARDTHERSR